MGGSEKASFPRARLDKNRQRIRKFELALCEMAHVDMETRMAKTEFQSKTLWILEIVLPPKRLMMILPDVEAKAMN